MRDAGETWHAVDREDYLYTPGVDWGRKLEIIFRHKDQIVVRRKGHRSWSGLGSTEYAETLYMRLRLEMDQATVLESCTPGRRWRDSRMLLIGNARRGAP